MRKVKALTFDTGGTILDWHSGFSAALRDVGLKYGEEKDWDSLANELRRKSLAFMLNLGKEVPPQYNFDGAHRMALDIVLEENGLGSVTKEERTEICMEKIHQLKCWPDFPPVLPRLRKLYICASFTLLSFRIVVDTSRANDIVWDAIFSCEGIGKYKVLPEVYQTTSRYLQLDPSEICMIACHNFDLDAAKRCGYKTAFVRRPDEWGGEGPPDPRPNPEHDIIVDSFAELETALDSLE